MGRWLSVSFSSSSLFSSMWSVAIPPLIGNWVYKHKTESSEKNSQDFLCLPKKIREMSLNIIQRLKRMMNEDQKGRNPTQSCTGMLKKSRQRCSRPFAVLTYSMYAPRVKKAAALLDLPPPKRLRAGRRTFLKHSLQLMRSAIGRPPRDRGHELFNSSMHGNRWCNLKAPCPS